MYEKGFLSKEFTEKAMSKYVEYSMEEVLETIYKHCPELKDEKYIIPTQGAHAHVIIFGEKNKRRVFKAPANSITVQIFENEVVVMSRLKGRGLKNPDIVRAVKNESLPFMEMEFVPGKPLSDNFMQTFSKKEKQKLAEDIVDFKIEMTKALGEPIAHGDLQVGNIFVDNKGRLKSVIDFGVLKIEEDQDDLYSSALGREFDEKFLKPAYEKRKHELDNIFAGYVPQPLTPEALYKK